MEIYTKESILIRPGKEMPRHRLWNSDLDIVGPDVYVPTVYFYRRPNNSSNFFEASLLKEALSSVLVPFYPVAGRLGQDENGRTEINCNGEGVLFVAAETDYVIDDLGDFSQGLKLLSLIPPVDDTKDISSRPLVLTQVTHFKCRGVCLGVRWNHLLGDGFSKYNFIKAWAEMARSQPISISPFFDRTILSAGIPTSPAFHHIEYDPPPAMNNPTTQSNPGSICTAVHKLSLDQINILKEKSKIDHGPPSKYSKFEIISAHIWRCVCKARGLSDDQATKLHFPTDGRSRLSPPLPSGYIGNAIFTTSLVALSGDIQSEPLSHTVERIHKAFKRMDDDYLRSALAYLKQQPNPTVLRRGSHTFKCPNLNIVNLSRMPMYDAHFGWGKPVFVRNVNTYYEGTTHILPSPNNDGSLCLTINLQTQRVQLFRKLFFDIFFQPPKCKI